MSSFTDVILRESLADYLQENRIRVSGRRPTSYMLARFVDAELAKEGRQLTSEKRQELINAVETLVSLKLVGIREGASDLVVSARFQEDGSVQRSVYKLN